MRKPETYKCSDKRCKICQNDLNETIIHNVKCSQYQMVKFGKFAEKLTTTQSMSYIIWNVKGVTKKKHISGKQ